MKKGIIAFLVIAIIGVIIYGINKPDETPNVSKEKESSKEKSYVYEASLYDLWQDEAKSKSAQGDSIVTINEVDERVLKNTKGGYELTLPKENKWELDDHVSNEYVRFFSKTHRVDITKQDTHKVWLFPNQFIEKTIEVIEPLIVGQKQIRIGNHDVKVVDYKREKLEGIVDDLNYYSYYFVTNDRDVIVFQLKTNEEDFETKKEEIEGIIATLTFTKVEEEVEGNHIMAPYAYKNNSIEIPENEFVMGVYLENTYDIQKLEKKLTVPFGAQLFYKSMAADYDYYVEDLINEGKIPVVTFLFEEVGKEEPIIEELLGGKYDKNITRWATKTKELKQDVLYRVGNEMNGDWSKWSHLHIYNDPDIYKMAYRHIVALFKTEGANNAKFVWNPNNNASPNYTWNQQEMYYPGDEFVDWVGLTAYNWGKTNWQEFQYFDDLYEVLYREYEQNHPEKPFMIAEFSSDEQGGDKARFIQEAFEKIGVKYPKIKIAIWFSHDHGDNYLTIDSSKESFEAFKKGIVSDHVVHKIYK